MDGNKAIQIHDRGAEAYDAAVDEYGSHAHDVLFGLCYEYAQPGESLLDIGIGTGLSSEPFARMGLTITGVDGSAEMLRICREKGFARELTHHDLLDLPLPYGPEAFQHVIACGLFHFIDDLAAIFGEVSRLVQAGGVFAFTVAREMPEEAGDEGESGTLVRVDTLSGVEIYAHDAAYIERLCQRNGLAHLKTLHFYAHAFDGPEIPLVMAAYVMRKAGDQARTA